MLFEQADKRRYDNYLIQAKLHGFDLKDKKSSKPKDQGHGFVQYNGDVESVKHLSAEVRQKMTEDLMGEFKKKFQDFGKQAK